MTDLISIADSMLFCLMLNRSTVLHRFYLPSYMKVLSSVTSHLDLTLTKTIEINDVVEPGYVWKTFRQWQQINGSKPECSVGSFV